MILHFRTRLGLSTPDALATWVERHDLDIDSFLHLMADEARVDWVDRLLEDETTEIILDVLRVAGLYQGWKERITEGDASGRGGPWRLDGHHHE